MMRVVGYLGAWTVLALASAWVTLDYVAADVVRRAVADVSAGGLVDFEKATLRLPGIARFAPASLTDPVTGRKVIELDSLSVRVQPDNHEDGWSIGPSSIKGTGGRLLIGGADDRLPLIRAIDLLGDAIEELRGDEPKRSLPPMEFRDITIVVEGDTRAGTPFEDQVVEDCTVWVDEVDGLVRIELRTGADGGSLQVRFPSAGGGPWETEARGVFLEPALLSVISPACDDLSRRFRPEGLVDVRVDVSREAGVLAVGTLSDATLRPAQVPFPLEHAHVPFELSNGRLKIDDAQVHAEGGILRASIEQTDAALEISADIEKGNFRRRLVDLVPALAELRWLRFEDGGSVELHMSYTDRTDGDGPVVTGWGGLHADRVWFGEGLDAGTLETYDGLLLEDLIGRFEINDGELELQETSARCASGLIVLHGTIDLETDALDMDVSLRDMDLSAVQAMISPEAAVDSELRGWLEGRVEFTGIAGSPTTNRGEGHLSIRAGNLWDLPVIGAVANALKPGEPRPSERQRLELDFRLRGSRFKFNELRLESTFLSLYSDRGEIDFKKGLALDILIIPIEVPLPIIGPVLEYIERKLLEVKVEGTLFKPEVTLMPVEVVTGPLTGFFGWVGGLFGDEDAGD